MNNNLLTPDRIEAARDAFNDPYIDVVDDGEESQCILYQDNFEEAMVTAIAALDLAERFRWRDPKVELPTLEEVFIAIDENGEVCLGEMYTRVYWDFEESLVCPNPRIMFSYSGDRYETNCDLETLQAWIPLPKWKGKNK